MVTVASTTISTCRASCAEVCGVHCVTGPPQGERLGADVEAWFTGAELADVADANLAHHRPHVPERLAAARDRVGRATRTDPASWHLMRQVHGADVAVVTGDLPAGAELRDVDVIATALPERPLVVLSADCLPILAGGVRAIAAAHAGWRGIVEDVPAALVGVLVALGEAAGDLRVAIGPAIGPCCYEVGPEVREAIGRVAPQALTRTREGASSVDLRVAAHARFTALGVDVVHDVGAAGRDAAACTACDPTWFSHRRDPTSGRQAGLIVRRSGSGRGSA